MNQALPREIALPIFINQRPDYSVGTLPTYEQYINYAIVKGFQPLKPQTFEAMLRIGFDPISNSYVRSNA
jgi:hypothetical protein